MITKQVELDDVETSLSHAKIIQQKSALKKLYTDYYLSFNEIETSHSG